MRASDRSSPRFGRRALLGGAAVVALGARSRLPLPLESACPALAALPRAGLWAGDSFAPAPALAQALCLPGGAWLARDDLGGTAFAGGKARKLDLLAADAVQRGATALATTGGTGSNQARSTALAARALGLHCKLALLPQPETAEVRRNLAAIRAAGAELSVGDHAAVARLERAAAASRGAIAWIPMGGTTPLGNVAFADAAFAASRAIVPAPDVAVVALGSCGSAVGLAIGFAIAGVATRVHAVRCSSAATSSRAVVDAQVDATVAWLRVLEPTLRQDLADDARARLTLDGAELGGGYAVATPRGNAAAERLGELEHVPLEPTYGAKAAAALLRAPRAWSGSRVLLWIGSDARWLRR